MEILAHKAGRLPLGIWLAWVALAFSAGVYLEVVIILKGFRYADLFVFWPVTIIAAIALFGRRLIAREFSGMSYALLLYHCVAHGKPIIGIPIAIFGFLGLIANRRWFDEYLLRT